MTGHMINTPDCSHPITNLDAPVSNDTFPLNKTTVIRSSDACSGFDCFVLFLTLIRLFIFNLDIGLFADNVFIYQTLVLFNTYLIPDSYNALFLVCGSEIRVNNHPVQSLRLKKKRGKEAGEKMKMLSVETTLAKQISFGEFYRNVNQTFECRKMFK